MEEVSSFKYLEMKLAKDGSCSPEIRTRIFSKVVMATLERRDNVRITTRSFVPGGL